MELAGVTLVVVIVFVVSVRSVAGARVGVASGIVERTVVFWLVTLVAENTTV